MKQMEEIRKWGNWKFAVKIQSENSFLESPNVFYFSFTKFQEKEMYHVFQGKSEIVKRYLLTFSKRKYKKTDGKIKLLSL